MGTLGQTLALSSCEAGTSTSGTHSPTRTSPKRDSAVVVPGPAPATPGAGSCRVQWAPVQAAPAGAAAVCGLAALFAVHTAPRFVCGGPRGRAWWRWRWAWHGHREHRGCSLLAALCRPCHVPVPAGHYGGAHVLPPPFARRLQLTQKLSEHRHSPEALPALAVSPATGSPSSPCSRFVQRCHILPQSMSPYLLSQKELPWAVSPLLPWAQHPCTGTHTATSSPGLALPPSHERPAGCRQGWGHAGPHERPCPYRSLTGGRWVPWSLAQVGS